MTSGVLDKPVDLALEDFDVACAMHEIAEGKPPCDNRATLLIRMHTCSNTFSCQPCWDDLFRYMQNKQRERTKDPIAKALGGWKCTVCGKSAKTFEDLMWAEPL